MKCCLRVVYQASATAATARARDRTLKKQQTHSQAILKHFCLTVVSSDNIVRLNLTYYQILKCCLTVVSSDNIVRLNLTYYQILKCCLRVVSSDNIVRLNLKYYQTLKCCLRVVFRDNIQTTFVYFVEMLSMLSLETTFRQHFVFFGNVVSRDNIQTTFCNFV